MCPEEDTLLSWKVIHLPQLPEEKRSELCLANRISQATHGVPDVTARPSSLRPSKNCTSSSGLRLGNGLVLQGMLSARWTVPSTVTVCQMEFYSGTVTKQRYKSLKHLKTQYHTELNLGELKVTQGPKELWYLFWKKSCFVHTHYLVWDAVSYLVPKSNSLTRNVGFLHGFYIHVFYMCLHVLVWACHSTHLETRGQPVGADSTMCVLGHQISCKYTYLLIHLGGPMNIWKC